MERLPQTLRHWLVSFNAAAQRRQLRRVRMWGDTPNQRVFQQLQHCATQASLSTQHGLGTQPGLDDGSVKKEDRCGTFCPDSPAQAIAGGVGRQHSP